MIAHTHIHINNYKKEIIVMICSCYDFFISENCSKMYHSKYNSEHSLQFQSLTFLTNKSFFSFNVYMSNIIRV